MFCDYCGRTVPEAAKFCRYCGAALSDGELPMIVPVVSDSHAAPAVLPAPSPPVKHTKSRGKDGHGSISRLSGNRSKPWQLRMPIPDPRTGISVSKVVGTFAEREEAEAKRVELLKQVRTPYILSTLEEIFEAFTTTIEYTGKSTSTRVLYDAAWQKLKPLWDIKIRDLYAHDFQKILDQLVQQGLSRSMIEKVRSLISMLYRTAIGWRVVDTNLASVLRITAPPSQERDIFRDEDIRKILEQRDDPTGEIVVALLACGARPFELFHFEKAHYHKAEDGTAYITGGCKTAKGRNRIMPILAFGIPVFDRAFEKAADGGLLFTNPRGNGIDEHNWRNRGFYPFLDRLGIQENPYDEQGHRRPECAGHLARFTPYTCRHTFSSLSNRAGVSKDLLKRAVGHTVSSKTLDEVYLHPQAAELQKEFQKADQLMEAICGGS